MSDMSTEKVEQQPEQQDQNNPAWNDILSVLPDSLHPLITPKLKEWDAAVNSKFEENATKYKPYEEIIEAGDPETISGALQLAAALEADPKAVYDLIAQQYGFTNQPPVGTQPTQQQPVVEYDDPQEKLIADLRSQIEQQQNVSKQIVEYLAGRQSQDQRVQQQQQLDTYLKGLHEQFKDFPFDDNYVVAQIANGVKGEKAVQMLQEMVQNYAKGLNSASDNAPVVSGASSSIPSNKTEMSTLNRQDTKQLVADLMKKAAEQNSA